MDPILWMVLLLTICFAGLLLWTVREIPRPLPSLAKNVGSRMEASGVDNLVTAVLLNFRGYDTLLEVTVLLLGVVTIWSISHAPSPPRIPDTSPVQIGAVRLLMPLIGLIGAYFIWQGSYRTGGAFQGGAVLSAGLVLLLISDFWWMPNRHFMPLRAGLVLGPLVFLAIAAGSMAFGGSFLEYPRGWSEDLILVIEAVCGISIGLTLAAFFAGGRPPGNLREQPYVADQEEEEDETS
jgi:multisubunit Na+/H+ antiporter MnhB subunit